VLPNLSDAVGIGERMRQALMAHSRDDRGLSHEVFLGRDSHGEPMRGHRHAFFLPEDADGDGRIDHILVWARGGFDPRSAAALRSVTRLWGSDGHDLWLALVGIGQPTDYGTSLRVQLPGGSSACGKSKVWRSVTPFVPTRHAKIRKGEWRDLPIQQVESLLRQEGHQPDEIVSLPEFGERKEGVRWSRFRRVRRSGHGSRGMDAAFGFELRFAEPVQGPIAVGYGAHFGLGRFEAVD
jgi:CRISPR-associated protein Csb2